MSRIYFHTPTDEAEVLGAERAHMGWLCRHVATSVVGLDSAGSAQRILSLLAPGHYMTQTEPYVDASTVVRREWTESMIRALGSMFGPALQWKGKPIAAFSLELNTAVVLGGDTLRLAARLHGQCEIHAYVEGPNRAWLADLIQAALDKAIFRQDVRDWNTGWNDVIKLLRSRDDEPVVTSYSVCDQFPNSHTGDWLPPWPEGVPRTWTALTEEQQQERSGREEAWYELPNEEQWRISMAGLRTNGQGLELKPDNWNSFAFGHGLTYLDLLATDYAERLDKADLTPSEEN